MYLPLGKVREINIRLKLTFETASLKTIKILEPVLDFDNYLDYSKAKNKHLLKEII